MALTVFFMYPNEDGAAAGTGGWNTHPTWSYVDDPNEAPDDADAGESQPVSSLLQWRASWGMTPPAAGVVITKVELYARIWAVSQNSTSHDLTNLKGFVDIDGTEYLTAGQTVTGTTGAQGPNPQTYLLGDFTTNPDTSTAWTIPELQALVAGVEFEDQDFGSNTPRTYLSQFYARVEATTIAQSIEGRRAEGTHYLLTLGRMHGVMEVQAPPVFVDVEPGTVIAVTDRLGPTPDGTGWGKRSWERRECLVLENEWVPGARRCRLVLFDLRFFKTSLWWQPLTDLAYTEEGQGIPYLDSGGGWTLVRNQKAYVRKQTADQLYAEVPLDFPKYTADGLQVGGGGDVTETLNNAFTSTSPGPVFANWTEVDTGTGDIVDDTADYVFDAAGLRRSARVTTGASAGSSAYLEQAHSITGPTYARVAILFKHDIGTAPPQWQLQRASDSFYWNDTAETWQASGVNNDMSLTSSGHLDGDYSRIIPLAAGADTYTLRVGYAAAAGASNQFHLYFAALVRGARADVDGFRTLAVTTTTAVTRIRDDVQLANAAPVRWWDPTRGGQIELRILTLFEHAAMADATYKVFLFLVTGVASNYWDALVYLRVSSTSGLFRYIRNVGGTQYATDVAVAGAALPILFREYKLAVRWTGPEEELDLAAYSVSVFVGPDYTTDPPGEGTWSTAQAAAQSMAAASYVHLGYEPTAGATGDFVLRRIRARMLCLTDEETQRELGE